jgi:DNA-binding SARP family transcriptional activator/Tfp pilus assembly protein PilF
MKASMTAEMEFGLLGPLIVRRGEEPVPVRQGRVVLAALLLNANQVVTGDALAEALWGETWRDKKRPTVQTGIANHVARLRRALRDEEQPRIFTYPGGYEIRVAPGQLDVIRFETLIADAGLAARSGSWPDAQAHARAALALWRGQPLADVPSETLRQREGDRLGELRLQALKVRLEADLNLGGHAEIIAELRHLTDAHPLDERLHALHMLALFRSGRQADALAAYEKARQVIADEMGVDPGPELRTLHQRIIEADPALTAAQLSAGSHARVPPRELPPAVSHFTGRAGELSALTRLLDQADTQEAGTVVISAIGGIAGIGKTTLALHWAHQHLDRFPDGQLWVNLRGFDPRGDPMPAEVAVGEFLEALGVAPAAVPASLDARARLYRSLLAGKRVLVVLDNAHDTSQVTPLLPGSPGCSALVTSRRDLAGLIATHGARSVDLDVLPETEARELLARHLGAERLAAESDATTTLLACCAGLPLALSVVAARAAAHPGFPLAVLAAELRDAARRLDSMEAGDPAISVRAVLSWSYRFLDPQSATMFGLLGLAPGPDISLPAANVLAGLPAPQTRAALRELEAASLVQQHVPGRYRMHDLVRLYAAEQAELDQPLEARTAALRRITDFYLLSAFAGDRQLEPEREPINPGLPADGWLPYQPATAAAALAWFEAEHRCLLAAQNVAVAQAWHRHVWQLAWALNTFHNYRGLLRNRAETWEAALAACGHLNEPTVQVLAHRLLGDAYARTGQHSEALDHLSQAILLAEQTADLNGQAHSHRLLATTWTMQGDHRQALEHAERALSLYRALDLPLRTAGVLNEVGWMHAHLGELDQARASCEAALALNRQLRFREAEAATLDSLGFIAFRASENAQAVDYYEQALALLRESGHSYHEAGVLDGLAAAYAADGQHDQARRAWHLALNLYQAQHRTADAARIQQQLDALGSLG